MNPVIIFDVNSTDYFKEVKLALLAAGYHAAWASNSIRYELPENCVWKPNSTLEIAYKEIETIVLRLNETKQEGSKILLLRCIVLSNNPWLGKAAEVVPV